MTQVLLTKHGEERMRQRLGLNRKACQRQAQTAYDRGQQHSEVKGRAKRFLDKLYLAHRNATNLRVYGGYAYLFAGCELVTVLLLPTWWRRS